MSNEPGSEECSRSLVVTTSVFSQNEGGGLAIFNGDVKLESSSFTSNAGTAVYFETSDDAGHTFEVSMPLLYYALWQNHFACHRTELNTYL